MAYHFADFIHFTREAGMTGMTGMRSFAAAAALLCACAPSIAAYTLQFTQTGADVVATGSGSLNTTALALYNSGGGYNAMVQGNAGVVHAGPAGGTATDLYTSITGPFSVGPGTSVFYADSGSGDKVGVQVSYVLVVPQGYASGAPLSSTSTWNVATFASLGLTPGEYVWSWGSGATADSFTLRIGLPQAITFTSTPPAGAMVGDAPYTVTATGGGSGNPVIFSIDPAAAGVCAIAGTSVSFIGAGTCVVNANQEGGSGYAPAPLAQQNFSVAARPLPITAADSYVTPSGATLSIPAPGVLANDSSPLALALTASLVTAPANGTLVLNPNGGFVYTPNGGFSGTDTFTYSAFDGMGTPPQTVTIVVVAAESPASIPTLGEWGLILMSSMLAMLGFGRLRRRVPR
ncbi:IPTL-CTERM sorting domain-containing protein [Ramlibacter sp. H39-3-26]|uniref:IPTL-CTERM sorting domain-containing protein n=1 Tax=Curvibacter soli TaxID=3031331 RepID=UPI0023DA0E32|nr:IPTL-CTERM sorting domain-containing protein [Ramlibacter sp. H39-3-26]MDF1484652.1 IPTL-CTERM sorting domain-containing protein [Ramlibacter sp. H39-3-26]